MTYGDVIAILPNILKKYYRKYESIKKKIIDYKWSMTFNKVLYFSQFRNSCRKYF